MIIRNASLIKQHRRAGRCEVCQKLCTAREGHHLISRGAGGSDIRINLIRLGQTRTHQCRCHSLHHMGGSPTTKEILSVVASREGCTPDDIMAVVRMIQQLDKKASSYFINERLLELSECQRAIARRELGESNRL